MPRSANLKLGAKFNIIISLLLISLFLVAAIMTYRREQSLVNRVAIDNARSIARQIVETRDYMSSVVKGEPDKNYNLVPQVVATNVAKRMTAGSDYYVRQVSLRYRNPNNRPDEFEAAQLKRFTTRSTLETSSIVRQKGREVFRYLLAMKAEKSCLECHGSYDTAPKFVQERFPRGHYSYDYKIGEIIGAVSVSIPIADLYRQVGANLKVDIAYRSMIFLLIIFVMWVLIRKSIINPVQLLSEAIVHVTKTGNFAERLPSRTNDEIGHLIAAFNEMMEELERKTLQSRESEERYRKFIEMSRLAVVTFMTDGKIVISNNQAEEMLGFSKHALLGESFYSFMENGDSIRENVTTYLQVGGWGGMGEESFQRVRSYNGKVIEVEMTILASMTDQKPLFTAILRELSPEKT
jgi:PAS domain S-box-containing protein